MPNDIKLKAGTSVQLQANTSGTLANNAAVACATADIDNAANLNLLANFQLICQWAVAPSIETVVELYLVPLLDGTNLATVDTSTPRITSVYFAGQFIVPLTTISTNMRLVLLGVPLPAYKCRAHLINKSGQTISAGWTLDVYPELGQVV